MQDFRFIETPSHGYLQVPKSFIKENIPEFVNQITPFSGQDIENVYLEEDQDATTFLTLLEQKELEHNIVLTLLDDFKITHNYDPKTFDIQFSVGETFYSGKKRYMVIKKEEVITVEAETGDQHILSIENPFKYLD